MGLASHIVSDERLGEPESNRQIFERLAANGWVPDSLIAPLRAMAGLRNVLLHTYQAVDLVLVRERLEHRLGDLLDFVTAIRTRLHP